MVVEDIKGLLMVVLISVTLLLEAICLEVTVLPEELSAGLALQRKCQMVIVVGFTLKTFYC